MRTEPVFIVINGILTSPGDARAWTDRAVTWLHSSAFVNVHAEKFEYFASALTRRFRQQRHAEELAALIRNYAGRPIHLVGHSNGCDLIVRALKITCTEIASIHLLAAACDEDFDRNGLNEDLTCGQIEQVHVYTSPNDGALKYFARTSRALFGWLGFGYGIPWLYRAEIRGATGARVALRPPRLRAQHVVRRRSFRRDAKPHPQKLMPDLKSLLLSICLACAVVALLASCATAPKGKDSDFNLIQTILDVALSDNFRGDFSVQRSHQYMDWDIRAGSLRKENGKWAFDWLTYERRSHFPIFSGLNWSSTTKGAFGSPPSAVAK